MIDLHLKDRARRMGEHGTAATEHIGIHLEQPPQAPWPEIEDTGSPQNRIRVASVWFVSICLQP